MLEAYTKERSLNELEAQLPQDAENVKHDLEHLFEDQPLSAHAGLLLARCYQLTGEPGESKRVLEELLVRNPGNASAKVELAKILHDQKELEAAIELMTEITNARPEIVENWLLLKEYLEQAGQDQASKNALAQYEMIKAFNENLGTAEQAFLKAEFVRADNLCRKLLEQVPGEVRVLRLLARLAKQFRHFEVSTSILSRCVETRPVDVSLGLDYATSLLASKNFQDALEQCDKLIGLTPAVANIYSIKAEVLYNLGRYEDAIVIYRELSEVHEHRELCLLHLGKVLKTVGKTTEAVSCFHRAIKGELALGQAYWELASLKTYRFSNQEIESMQQLLSAGKLPAMNRMLIQFALGKALEDNSQFAESFKQYQSANNAYTRIRPYRYSNQNSRLISFFSQAYFSQAYFSGQSENGHDSETPIFVVGMPRSGSTLVEQILTSHSQVDATTELIGITSISRQLNVSSLPGKGEYPQSIARLSAKQIQELAQGYLDYAQSYRLDAPYFVDKSPVNFHHIGLIKTLFPRAKIIDVRRHPMASGWSAYRHFFADSFLFSYDLTSIGKYYNDYIELMDHWHTVLPGQILTLNYEDLIEDLPGKLDIILQYCGLAFEDACLNFHLNKRAVATPSSEQVRQPVYTHALGHWKNYEQFLSPLKQTIRNYTFSD